MLDNVNGQTIEALIEKREVPSGRKVHIAGDVSATNCLMEVFDAKSQETYVKVLYNGQRITDFDWVFNHLQSVGKYGDSSIENIVLSPAGPLNPDGTVKMTRAPFTLDAKTIHQPVAMINDYAAKLYAVAVFGLEDQLEHVDLRHIEGHLGERVPNGRMVILGPGTGLGCGRLVFDEEKGLYLPLDSEGGHTSATVDVGSDFEVGVMRLLKKLYGDKHPHVEAICSGKGISDTFRTVISFTGVTPADINDYGSAPDKAAFIANRAKEHPDSIYGRTMDFMWLVYGRALRDKAVHENARGGVWVAGGIPRKNILKEGTLVNERIQNLIMYEFDNGPSHSEWVNNIPVKVIMDAEDGLRGAKAVASNRVYMKREQYAPGA